MLTWLKLHFIPHEANNHKPHFLRSQNAALILVLIILVELMYLVGAYVVIPNSRSLAAVFSSVLIDETNTERVQNGALAQLTLNPVLVHAAQIKADDMAARGYFSHNTPDGKEPWYFLDQVGYTYDAAGENLAVNFTESSDVTRAWMNSPGHRANILSGKYTEIGIATAQGQYKGAPAIFVVQFFGHPKPVDPFADLAFVKPAFAATTSESVAGSTTKIVAGTSTKKIPKMTPLFPATTTRNTQVQNSSTTPIENVQRATTSTSNAVLGEEKGGGAMHLAAPTAVTPKYGFWTHVLLSSRSVATTIYLVMGFVILLALVLAIGVKWRVQHPHIIINGLSLLFLIALLLLLNVLLPSVLGVI